MKFDYFISELIDIFLSRKFIKFIFVGVVAAAANFLTRKYASIFIGFNYSILVGYVVGFYIAFTLNRCVTFTYNEYIHVHSVFNQLKYFISVNILGFSQTFIVSIVLRYAFLKTSMEHRLAEDVAHFFGLAVPAFSSYIAHNYISFGKYGFRGFVKEFYRKLVD